MCRSLILLKLGAKLSASGESGGNAEHTFWLGLSLYLFFWFLLVCHNLSICSVCANAKFIRVSVDLKFHHAVICRFLAGLPSAGDAWFSLSLSVFALLSVFFSPQWSEKLNCQWWNRQRCFNQRFIKQSAKCSSRQIFLWKIRMNRLNLGSISTEQLPGKVSLPGNDSVVCLCVQQEAFSPPAPTSTRCSALLCPNTKMFRNWCHRWTWWTRPAASPWPMHVSEVKSVLLRGIVSWMLAKQTRLTCFGWVSQVFCLCNYGSIYHPPIIWTWFWTWSCLKTVKSNPNGGFNRAGSSSKCTESRGICALNGVWLLGTFSTVGLENNVLTLFCSAQSCRSYYTFKSPDRITVGSYESGGRAGGPRAPNTFQASILVLLLSAIVARGRTFPGSPGRRSLHLSLSR